MARERDRREKRTFQLSLRQQEEQLHNKYGKPHTTSESELTVFAPQYGESLVQEPIILDESDDDELVKTTTSDVSTKNKIATASTPTQLLLSPCVSRGKYLKCILTVVIAKCRLCYGCSGQVITDNISLLGRCYSIIIIEKEETDIS